MVLVIFRYPDRKLAPAPSVANLFNQIRLRLGRRRCHDCYSLVYAALKGNQVASGVALSAQDEAGVYWDSEVQRGNPRIRMTGQASDLAPVVNSQAHGRG